MNPNLIPTIMTAAFFVCVGVGLLIGFFKGAIKGAVDIGVTALCAVLALPITKLLSNILFSEKLISFVLNKLSTSLTPELGSYITDIQSLLQGEETGRAISEIVKMIFSLPVAFVLPIVFIAVFITLLIIAHIIAIIVESLACPKTKNVWLKILGGALTGGASALIAITVLIPMIGYTNLASNSIEYFKEATKATEVREEPKRSELINNKAYGVMDKILTYVEPVNNNFVSKAVYVCGGKGIFRILTTTKVSSLDVNLENEINGAVDVYDSVMVFVDDSPENYGEAQIEAVDNINQYLERSELLPFLLSRTISFVASEFHQGNSIMGIEKPNLGEEVNPTFDRILAVLAETDSDAIRKDLKTITDIASTAVNEGVIEKVTEEEKDIWGIFENPKVIEAIFVELYENERTRNMIPYITGAVTNYVYRMYNDVNGTDIKPEEFDYGIYNEEQLKAEAVYIANSVKEIHKFVDSADFAGEFDPQEVILTADLGALGRGLMELRNGIFTERLFEILLKSILESEAIDELGVIDSYVINEATKPNANLEAMLVSRQNILKLAIAVKDKQEKEETQRLMDSVIESLLTDDGESLGSFVNENNLISIGMSEEEAKSIEGIVGSMIDGANKCEFENEEEKQIEIEKTEEIITAVGNTVLEKEQEHMFKTDSNDESTTDMTASEFVDKITDSKLTSSMVQNAIIGENGETKEDPYNIQGQISEDDKNEISSSISEKYQNASEEEKKTLDALASIFGVTIE